MGNLTAGLLPAGVGLEGLLEASHALARAADLVVVREIVAGCAGAVTGADDAWLLLGEQTAEPTPSRLQGCLRDWVLHHRRPALIADVHDDERVPARVLREGDPRAVMMVPLRSERSHGVLAHTWHGVGRRGGSELERLQGLAEHVAAAVDSVLQRQSLETALRRQGAELEAVRQRLEHAQAARERAEVALRDLSLTDPLTGLANRRGFFRHGARALEEACSLGRSSALLSIGIDGLRQINDRYGPELGDSLVAEAGQLLRESFGEGDVLARLRAEEFAVFSVDGSHPEVTRARLEAEVERHNLRRRRPYRLWLSIGTVLCDPGCEQDLQTHLREANRQMAARRQLSRGTRRFV